MKKTIGNYTPDAGKVLKQSERVICCTGEDGMIYVTNGYLAYKFTPREYAAIVQPAVCCEAGSWTMNNGQKTGEPPTFDLAKTFRDAEHKAASMEALERCPLNLDTGKKRTAAAFYNAARGFAALYNAQYLEALAPGYTLRSPGSHAPAIAYQNGESFAMILPIRIDDKISRAVKAYFTQPDDNAGNADERRAELRDKLAAAEAECAALRAELDKSKAAQAAAEQAAQRANETAAAAIADTVAPSPKTAAPRRGTQDGRGADRLPLVQRGRRDSDHQGRADHKPGFMAHRRHGPPRRRDQGPGRKVEQQARRLLRPGRLTTSQQPKRPTPGRPPDPAPRR